MTAQNGTPNAVGWQRKEESGGIVTFRLASWAHYFDFLEAELFHESIKSRHKYIWRGQRMNWPLSSSLDRLFKKLNLSELQTLERLTAEHLESFKFATRGRRGLNPAELLENEWWALGQHFGLATPLLDWTRSPFAAAYFAFEELTAEAIECRIVYGLDQNAVSQRNKELDETESYEHGRPPLLEFIDPMSDENPRFGQPGWYFYTSPDWDISRAVGRRSLCECFRLCSAKN